MLHISPHTYDGVSLVPEPVGEKDILSRPNDPEIG